MFWGHGPLDPPVDLAYWLDALQLTFVLRQEQLSCKRLRPLWNFIYCHSTYKLVWNIHWIATATCKAWWPSSKAFFSLWMITGKNGAQLTDHYTQLLIFMICWCLQSCCSTKINRKWQQTLQINWCVEKLTRKPTIVCCSKMNEWNNTLELNKKLKFKSAREWNDQDSWKKHNQMQIRRLQYKPMFSHEMKNRNTEQQK